VTDIVLDTSALQALLLGEPGADTVADIVDRARMSAVNYAEIFTYYARQGVARADIADMLAPLPIIIVPADDGLAADAGMLRWPTLAAGLSLGDRFCLALAKRENLPAWTADKVWISVAAAIGVEVKLIR
jgi:PIN domain nuclease of toxin-antitoxin system